jgi:hypothetical protein
MDKRNNYAWNQRAIETPRIRIKTSAFSYLFDVCKIMLSLPVSSRGYSFRK